MQRNLYATLGAAALLAMMIACGNDSPPPTSPSAVASRETSAAADGTTLKVTAPTRIRSCGPDMRRLRCESGVRSAGRARRQSSPSRSRLGWRFSIDDFSNAALRKMPCANLP